MKDIVANIVRGGGKNLNYLLAAAFVCGAFAAQAALTQAYYQVAGTQDVLEVSMDGLPFDKEITYGTPQLAFPGVRLDDIHQCTFITEIYGSWVPTSTAWGLHPSRYYEDGHVEKLALQCAVYDGGYTKGVVIVLTNGNDGVYVHKYARIVRNSKLNTPCYSMDSNGTLSLAKENHSNSSTSAEGGYQARGLKIHGMSTSPTARLAFPGATLNDLKDCGFVAGYQAGLNLENSFVNNYARFIECWPKSGNVEKIVMQFEAVDDKNSKCAIIQLTNGVGGVYAAQTHHAYKESSSGEQRYSLNDDGTVSVKNCVDKYSGLTSDANGKYSVHELFALPQCVKKTPNKIKVWPSGNAAAPLTLKDIRYGKFTARMCGSYLPASFRYTPNSAVGYNKKICKDKAGNVTSIIVEFQVKDGDYVKCLVVSFEEGADGIYATAINARYASSEEIGYTFRDYEGNLSGNVNNSSKGEIVAETFAAEGYGVFDLRVVVPAGFMVIVK